MSGRADFEESRGGLQVQARRLPPFAHRAGKRVVSRGTRESSGGRLSQAAGDDDDAGGTVPGVDSDMNTL